MPFFRETKKEFKKNKQFKELLGIYLFIYVTQNLKHENETEIKQILMEFIILTIFYEYPNDA